MKPFSEIEQRTLDLDWFGVDVEGQLGHFATNAARLLPPSVACDHDAWEQVYDYFKSCDKRGRAWFCERLSEERTWSNNRIKKAAMTSFGELSERGLFSYDSRDSSQRGTPYFRVTIPENPLRIDDLPSEIAILVRRSTFPRVNFARDARIADSLLIATSED